MVSGPNNKSEGLYGETAKQRAEEFLKQLEAQKKPEEEHIKWLYKFRLKEEEKLRKSVDKIIERSTDIQWKRDRENAIKEVEEISKLEIEAAEARRKQIGAGFKGDSKDWGKAFAEEATTRFKANIGKVLTEKLNTAIDSAVSSSLSKITTVMDAYVESQTAMAAHLAGTTADSANDLMRTIRSAVGMSGIVKQEELYKNLNEFVKKGMVYNVEQRAFLQTIATDIDAAFNAADGTLTRLIRLQTEDMSANRLAIEYSLQEFLNTNYQTSEYIKDAMYSVSNSLLEMQSLMSVQSGMSAEATLQTWLGSMYSAGMSSETINAMAAAINALGSGNVNDLGSGISNLLLMGVNRSGLDYSQMINEGVTAGQIDKIMAGMLNYMGEIGESSSNVVKSQWAAAFGLKVSDLVAASNVKDMTAGTLSVTTDIYDSLLDNYGTLVPLVTKIQNSLDNILYGTGTAIGSNAITYGAFKAANLAAEIYAATLGDMSLESSFFGQGVSINVSSLVKAMPLVAAVLGTGIYDGISGLLTGTNSWGSASGIFDALANGTLGAKVKGAGSGTSVVTSGTDVSQSMYMSTSGSDILGSAMNNSAINEAAQTINGDSTSYSTTDIYTLLDNNLGYISTAARQDKQYNLTDERLLSIANSTSQILSFLQTTLTSMNLSIDDLRNTVSMLSASGNGYN